MDEWMLPLQDKQAIQLWFEFYKLALQDPRYSDLTERSRHFYSDWGDITNTDFDSWWKEKQELFMEPAPVYTFEPDEFPVERKEGFIYIAIRENVSANLAIEALSYILTNTLKKSDAKHQHVSVAKYTLTQGKEVRVETHTHLLNVYRDVYLKLNRPPINEAFLKRIYAYYKGKDKKIPSQFGVDDGIHASLDNNLRLIRRQMAQADQLVESAAKGEFPG